MGPNLALFVVSVLLCIEMCHHPNPEVSDVKKSAPKRKKNLTAKEQLESYEEEFLDLQSDFQKLQENSAKKAPPSQLIKERKRIDELLTRILLKLDAVESNGITEIRAARKAQIKRIEEVSAYFYKSLIHFPCKCKYAYTMQI